MKRWFWLSAIFLTVETECHFSDMYVANQCQTIVKTFETKELLAKYLKSQYSPMMVCDGPCVRVYEATPIDYKVTVQTEQRKTQFIETVETGREIQFK